MAQVVFYNDNGVWVYKNGVSDALKTAVPGNYRRSTIEDKVAILGEYNEYPLFDYTQVTQIQKSATPGDNYTDLTDFIGATESFFVRASGGGFIGGQVPTFADLPDPLINAGQFWLVEQGSGIYLINRKPAGLYYSNGSSWNAAPDIVPYFSDANFEVYNELDNTKGIKFDLSSLITGIKRLITFPNKDARLIYKDNVIHVSPNGGDFTTVSAARASITDNSSTNRYTIRVGPGIYNEVNPIPGGEYITIKSEGKNQDVRLVATVANQPMFTLANNFFIIDLTIFGTTGINVPAIDGDFVGATLLEGITFSECSNGLIVNNANADVTIRNTALLALTITMNYGIQNISGNVSVGGLVVLASSTINKVFYSNGSTALNTVDQLVSFSPNVSTALELYNGSRSNLAATRIINATDGVVIGGNNTDCRFAAINIFNCTNDGVRVDNIGTDIVISAFAFQIEGNTKNFNVLNPNCTIYGQGYTEIDFLEVIEGASFFASIIDLKTGDEGTNNLGEFRVGTAQRPAESSFGGGDSYTRGMLVYTFDGTSYVDVTVEASNLDGLTFSFPNTNVGTCIYVASAVPIGGDYHKYGGLKMEVNSAVVLGGGVIAQEYWNGTAWVDMNFSIRDSGGNYYPHAEEIFQQIGSVQDRFTAQLPFLWENSDDPGLGVDLPWMRLRIATAITTSPVIEQFKLHTDRMEINTDGYIEYYGSARSIGQLGLDFSSGQPFEGNMQSRTIYISQDIGVGYQNNRFTATGDKKGIAGYLPWDLDTSTPVILAWRGRATNTETMQWTVRWGWVNDSSGDIYYLTEPGPITNSRSLVIQKDVIAGDVIEFAALLDISKMIGQRAGAGGDELWISIQPNQMAGSFDATTSEITYTKWGEGGHV